MSTSFFDTGTITGYYGVLTGYGCLSYSRSGLYTIMKGGSVIGRTGVLVTVAIFKLGR